MKVILGSPGTSSGLCLRLWQISFSSASIGVMASALGFSSYTAFCYLMASMGLQLLWSIALAYLDFYALMTKKDLHTPLLLSLFVVGDWVTAILSFAAACSSAGVTVLFTKDVQYCQIYPQIPCNRYAISVVFAFFAWLFSAMSSVVMFWLVASA